MDNDFKHSYSSNHGGSVSKVTLAKQIICERFNNRLNPFLVGIFSNRYCTEAERCKEDKRYCSNISKKYNEFNLHDYYDQPITLLGEDSPYDLQISSSDTRRHNIYIVFTTNEQPLNIPEGSQDLIMEIRINCMYDLHLLKTSKVFKQGPSVKFHHFKDRPIKPEMLVWELKKLGKQTPTCRAEVNDNLLKRYVIHPDGSFDCFVLNKHQARVHDETSLMDITYNTYYFKGFDPGKELARKDWRARFCDYCEHCITSIRGTTRCELNLNGTTRNQTFKRTLGPKCPKFLWRYYTTAAVDWTGEDVKPKEGVDYFIWKNPAFKK